VLEARLLGQFDVRLDGKPAVISSRAAQSLLAYLLLYAGTAHRREKLAGLLWPDTSDDNARRNLRQELWRLRKAIGPDYFRADDIAVSLVARDDLWLDTAVALRAAANGTAPDDLAEALGNYRGELLPGFYEEWIAPERERLRDVFEQAAKRLTEQLITDQRWAEVLLWAERWIALGHSAEPAFRALMLAYAQQGDKAQVAAVYQRCVNALRSDLGVEPSEQTRALYERLITSTPSVAPLPGAAFQTVPLDALDQPAPGEPPFKGLLYFDEADAANFFGRDQLTARLVAQLRGHTLLVVVGASGSGKSSLVRAGVVPALRQGEFSAGSRSAVDSSQSSIYLVTPTAHPLEALADCLTRDSESLSALATLMDDMARDPRSLRFALRRTLSAGAASSIYLVIDQFEELFTLCHDDSERQAFVDNLLEVVGSEGEAVAKVVIALRADFYAHCAEYPDLREAVASQQVFIGSMSAEELRRSIEGPAQAGGWQFEAGLVDLILREVGTEPGALPLLSHALLETWRLRQGRTLTFQGYTACGGVRGAIAQTAETVYRAFTPEQQAIARNMFLRLTELGEGTQDTRRRVTIGELSSRTTDAPAITSVLQTLADARLITLGADSAEVAHEALIREWPRLREWLDRDREGLRLHRHLTDAAQAWLKLNRDAGELYRGTRLAQAQEWAKANAPQLNPLEREFLEAAQALLALEESEREARRRRELQAAQQLAEAETQRAEAERQRAEAETQRAEEQVHAAQKLTEMERQRAEVQTIAAHKLRSRALFLAGALLLAALLAASSALLAQQSNANAERAEEERRIAYVRELSVNAVANLDVDPERSILLALQAVSSSTARGKPVLLEAEEALHRAVMTSRLQFTLRGHSNGVVGIAFSPDGRRIATTSRDQTAKVWDAATGQEILTLSGHTGQLFSIAYSPDGKRLATASNDKTAKVWDAATGAELLTLTGHTDVVSEVTFSPDGTRLATSSGFGNTETVDHTAKVWDAASGKELLTLIGHTKGVNAITYSPDGRRLATGSNDNTAKIWDAATGKELLTLAGHTKDVRSLAFSPDGKRLATGSTDGTAKVWDTATGQFLMTLFTDSYTVNSIAFDSAGTRILTSRADGTAKVWDAANGQLLLTLAGHSANVGHAVFSPDGTRVATASGDLTARVWDVSPAGGREWLTLANHNGPIRSVAYSGDGRRIATASADRTAKVWDAQTGKELLTLSGHTDDVRDIVFSPDGSRLATNSSDQTARLWDAATGKELLNVPTESYRNGFGLHVAISPDGQRIAVPGPGDLNTTTGAGVLKLWDIRSGKELLTLTGHRGAVYGVAFSPDGKRVATGSTDITAKVWDISTALNTGAVTGKELLSLVGHTSGVFDVNFSPDGRWIATASVDGARVWDAASGQLLLTLSGHTGQVRSSVFSPDGTRLATGGTDGTAKVWDVSPASGRQEQPLTLYGHGTTVHRAIFSPDGKRLVTAGADGTARVYALPIDDIVAIAKTRVTRSLTTDECQKYLHTETCPSTQ
jgi:WD40 repeat protein/DNA-binding SARP family transcriptional activator